MIIPSGTSAQRPPPDVGSAYIDLDLGRVLIIADGTGWRDAFGKSLGNGPQNIRSTVNSDNSITISWDSVLNATTYKLYEDQSLAGVSGATALTQATTTQSPGVNRTYHYWVTAIVNGVESDPSAKTTATLPYGATTPPPGGGTTTPDNFKMAFSGSLNAADSACFTKMKLMAPDYFYVPGNIFIDDGSTDHQAHWTAKFGAPNYSSFLSTLPNPQIVNWGDRDFGFAVHAAGSGNSITPTANAAYRAQFPAVTLPAADGIYRTFTRGRVRFIMLDERSYKSPISTTDTSAKTMLGTTQKNWLKGLLASSQYPLIVLLGDTQWVGSNVDGDDSWDGYNTERQELSSAFTASPAAIIRLSGNTPSMAYGHSQYGISRVWQAGPLNNVSAVNQAGAGYIATYPSGTGLGSTEQLFGWVSFQDDGTTLTISFTGYSSDGTVRLNDSLIYAPNTNPGGGGGGGGTPAPGGALGNTPAEILKINGVKGGTGGNWNEGIGFHSGDAEGSNHVNISYTDIANGYSRTFYFEPNANKTAVKFSVYCDGAKTSSNTHYPRSELRELTSGGGSNMSFDASSGTHHLSGTSTVNHGTSTKDEVVIAQMHDGSGDTLQLLVSSSNLIISVAGTRQNSSPLLTGYSKGTPIDWDILLVNGKLTVKINGQLKYSATPGYGSGQYFKAGCYAQAASGYTSGVSASDYFSVDLVNLVASHA